MSAYQDIYTDLERSGGLDSWLAPPVRPAWQKTTLRARGDGWAVEMTVRVKVPYERAKWRPE